VLVAHICNPGYSGGRDQEDHCLQIAYETLSQKYPSQKKKKPSVVAQGEGPEFKPQYRKKKFLNLSKLQFPHL
jgi:hypothetical protein